MPGTRRAFVTNELFVVLGIFLFLHSLVRMAIYRELA